MSEVHSSTDSADSPLVEREVDRLCDEFEREWLPGQPSTVESYLCRIAESNRSQLLVELVALEVELRRGVGETPYLEDYHKRFPEDTETMDRAFGLAPHQSREAVAETIDDGPSAKAGDSKLAEAKEAAPSHPEKIGPYDIKKVLGQGSFGWVYLGNDPELDRLVAIKAPRMERFSSEEEIDHFAEEAHTLGKLTHPGIITVYGVHREGESLYIIEEYIDGQNLASVLNSGPLSQERAVQLLVKVAEAADYAVHQGLIHRDLKPANILVDQEGLPHLADFGLAIHESLQRQHKGEVAGSPAYMSPEQVRGETHRLDGRSDIWSMGVMLYEMLLGRRPFRGSDRGEVFEEIRSHHPKPPRQIDPSIPRELERICLKCMSKKMAERFATSGDLADDLRHWLEIRHAAEQPTGEKRPPQIATPTEATGTAPDESPAKIVPKGLRSFDAGDADFFLDLLPGPRDRNGLPETLRFWKRSLEELDPDETFSVAVLYGPSGCGKSSLVKAGLMPQLAGHVVPVYVEATANDTEVRLLKGLRKQCPALPSDVSLPEIFELLRETERFPAGKKVLVIFDQFEQWLHANRCNLDTQLVDALRQCDGRRVQCLILVRDDFWLAISRFMDALEVPLVEGTNSALVDLFDLFHASKVLSEFGRSLGRLPENGNLAKEQEDFLERALAELAIDGKVIPVRLALFAEMFKGKAWTPKTLRTVGGAAGIGVAFLDETFSSKTAPPEHRLHQRAARACLQALLPEKGSVIRGHMRSRQQLLEASGYEQRPEAFDVLVRILDGELRLITPTQPDGSEFLDEDDSSAASDGAYYQLTHDYLVPALRDWLTRKQRETRCGRAELRLAERAELWNAKRERKQLPSWWEWLCIRLCGRKRYWTDPQRQMMRTAARFHAVRGALALVVLLLLLVAGFEVYGVSRAKALVDQLLTAETAQVPQIVGDMSSYGRWTAPVLEERIGQGVEEPQEDMRIRMALLKSDPKQAPHLVEHLLIGTPPEVRIIRDALVSHSDTVTEQLWATLAEAERPKATRLRVACALATLARKDERWSDFGEHVAHWLVSDTALTMDDWTKLLHPVRGILIPPLETTYRSSQDPGLRKAAALILSDYLSDDPDQLVALIKEARAEQLRFITSNSSIQGEELISLLTWELDRPWKDLARRKRTDAASANAAVALMRFGQTDTTWPHLESGADPTLRNYLIQRIAMSGVDPDVLVDRLRGQPKANEQRALLLSLGQYDAGLFPKRLRGELIRLAQDLFENAPDAGVHSASEWLLHRLGADQVLNEVRKRLAENPPDDERQWYVTSKDRHTMTVVEGPVSFTMGSPETEQGRDNDEVSHEARTNGTFAISTKEVTVEQFCRFKPDFPFDGTMSPQAVCPINYVSLRDAMSYCNWLSEREGIADDQLCYHYENGRMRARPDALSRTGYRLPTEVEWEYACRAGTTTSRFFGEAPDLLEAYAWSALNANGVTHPVGVLMPNDFGMFDVHGNMDEWCHDPYVAHLVNDAPLPKSVLFVLRGGCVNSRDSGLRSAARRRGNANGSTTSIGFRIARSL